MADGAAAFASLTDLQRQVQAWCEAEWGGTYWPPLGNLARLVEEVGEVARVVNDQYGYKPKKVDEPAQELGLELADVIFSVVALANSAGIDLAASFAAMMQKYRQRDSGRYQSGAGQDDGQRTTSR